MEGELDGCDVGQLELDGFEVGIENGLRVGIEEGDGVGIDEGVEEDGIEEGELVG